MKIFLNINTPEGNLFTPIQIYNTALHEIFHALGFMGHSYNPHDVMYMSRNAYNSDENSRNELSQADITTYNLFYKIKPDITNNTNNKNLYIPYLILGDDSDLAYAKYEEAKNYIKEAPNLPGGYIDLADAFVSHQEFDKAINCLNKALHLSKTYRQLFMVYYNLALCNFKIEEYQQALTYLEQALQIKTDKECELLKAEILLNLDKKQGRKEFEYLTQTYPSDFEITKRISDIYIREHKYLKARKILKTYIKNNPEKKNNHQLSPYRILLF